MLALRQGLRVLRRPPLAVKAVVLLAAVLYYTTAGFMFFELEGRPELNWVDALWWSVVTMSTVGFGDFFPITTGGRLLVGVPAMMVGVAVFSYAFSQAAVFFMRAESFNRRGFTMQKIPEAILVCNFPSRPRFQRVLAEIRAQPDLTNLAVVVVDEALESLDADLAEENVHFVRGHPGREQTLRQANVTGASRAVVLARDPARADSDNFTLAICLSIRHLCPTLRLVAECVDPENEEILRRAGCESIVCVMNLAPSILAHELFDPGVVDVLHELTIWNERQNNIFIVPLHLPSTAAVGDLRRWSAERGMTLLGIRRTGQVTLNPEGQLALQAGDQAVMMGAKRPAQIVLG